jgi:acyl carrier protein
MTTPFQLESRASAEETTERISTWILSFVAGAKRSRQFTPKPSHRFEDFGLDSISTVKLAVELSEWLAIDVDPVLAFEHPTVERLARHLAQELHARS